MSAHEPFPSVVPMPYLMPLYKAHVNDVASVRHHIFHPLERIWQLAINHIRKDRINDPAARLVALPRIKEQFTILSSYSSASPNLKRALFELPLEDIFDKCVSSFYISNRFEVEISEVGRWFNGCAMHPQADTDKSLTPYLRQYDMIQGTFDENNAAPIEDATYAADPSFCGNFSQMKDALERIYKAMGEPAYLDVLQSIVQLGSNVVDMFLFADRYTESHDPIDGIFLEGLECVVWAWDNLLDNPSGNMTRDIRVFLTEEVPREPLVTEMLSHLLAKVRINSVEKTRHKLHSVMWTSILRYAAVLPGKPRDKLDAVVQNAPNLEADQKKHILAALAGELPEVERPVRTTDEVTAELSAHAARLYNDNDNEPQDVPIEALGPEIDPRTLGHSSTEAPSADEQCTICRGEFAATEEPFLALDACNHLFHVDCLDPWVNRVELGLYTIQCPYCRARLCDARDYRGVVEE